MSLKKSCAYCGALTDKRGREHVFPNNLYPPSKAKSRIQRLTIPACNQCNNSWADDEAHFRNMLVLAGDPSTPVKDELWNTTVDRSFSQIDGIRRLDDLIAQMKPVLLDGHLRHKVYPGNDPRVIRVIRKIIRGLYYHHQFSSSPLLEDKIFVDVLKYQIPEIVFSGMEFHDRDKEIVEYGFMIANDQDIESGWLITFFQTVTFIGIVSN